jgi:hypothetical protein
MSVAREGSRGLAFLAAGIAAVVLAVLLFGLTTPAGAVDWVSVVTALAGIGLAVEGVHMAFRRRVRR